MLQTLLFHPTVSRWFAEQFAEPTEVQLAAWPVIADGQHALITAPTGSGKTLTAFLWALSQLAHNKTSTDNHAADNTKPATQTKVLYISPLKALNNDIQRNLLEPLHTLEADYGFPQLQVQTRSGDTPQATRQQMLRRPPDILITTPESLSLMLTTRKGRLALAHIETLIMDEIHSLVDNRRGVQLLTNLERLADIAGEFQRIALSATVSPLTAVAQYVAGKSADGAPRRVEIINTPGNKQINFRVHFPQAARDAAENGEKIWGPLSDSFREVINANQSTLFFTNSRRLAEKITLQINQQQTAPLAYAHHGSLARDVRHEVEKRLKKGELQAIVATNSLAMGIDIGHLDEVVMVQSPPSVADTLQRVGRAGHNVGEVSNGTLFPTHAHDFLEAAVLAEAVTAKDIEPQKLMHGALDVLAQIIISICATDAWPVDEVYQLVKRAAPYHQLSREQFDLVIEMLSGRYAGSRIRELKARLHHDRINHTVKATRGALLALYSSGGTIPDRGYYQMRHADSGAVLGELDEEFVWEATVGDNFTLGTQAWQVQHITHNDVVVRPARGGSTAPPFWRSEFFSRSFHFSSRIGQFLEMADGQLSQGEGHQLQQNLEDNAGFNTCAAAELVEYLQRQRRHTKVPLPHRHHLLLELVKSGPAGYQGPDDPQQLVIHTCWGGALNHPWALALRAAWQQQFQTKVDIHADNNAIVVQCKGDLDPSQVLTLVTSERLLELLRLSLDSSGFFGARFRECAGRSLLLTKPRFNQRLPLWMSRMQAKKLLVQVKKFSEFPVLLETWRTCLEDEFDLAALNQVLAELADGTITWSYVTSSSPSPFAQNLTFSQVSRYMYADDTPEDDIADGVSSLSADIISQALQDPGLRPPIEAEIVALYEQKRQRRAPGYAPESTEDWSEWLKERILIPADELSDIPALISSLPDTAVWVSTANDTRWLTHLELVHTLYHSALLPASAQAVLNSAVATTASTQSAGKHCAQPDTWPEVDDPRDAVQLAREVMSFYGPRSTAQLADLLPGLPDNLLHTDDTLICGQLLADSSAQVWCDAENLEILMRLQRASRRANFAALDADALPGFWAGLHRLQGVENEQNLLYAMEILRGYGAAVGSWLQDLLAARIQTFDPGRWEQTLSQFGLAWRGVGKEMITFAYPEELQLLSQQAETPKFTEAFTDPQARYTFNQIADATGSLSTELSTPWWQAVWAGQIACDSIKPLAQGLTQKFTLGGKEGGELQPLSSRRRLRRAPRGWQGNWFLCTDAEDSDPLSTLEADKERVRLLIDRYGFINRDIVNRENLPYGQQRWRWRMAFRALRIMELAGEVITGHFFKQLASPQFISPRALHALTNNTVNQQSFWVSAVDPVAPCGLGLDWPQLPQRRAGNFLSFHNSQLALVVESSGKELTYYRPWDDSNLALINAPLHHLVEHRRQHLPVQRINGEDARKSPYLQPLSQQFTVVHDHKSITLQPSY